MQRGSTLCRKFRIWCNCKLGSLLDAKCLLVLLIIRAQNILFYMNCCSGENRRCINSALRWYINGLKKDLFKISLLHFICTPSALNACVWRTGTVIKIVFAKGATLLNKAVNTHQLPINSKLPPGSFFYINLQYRRRFLVLHMTDLGGSQRNNVKPQTNSRFSNIMISVALLE